jgi:polysaccharide export outer membrane protein
MAPVRVARAFRFSITATMTALALSGCMRTAGPVAVAPQSDLDSMAYGQPYSPPPQAVAADSGGGAIGALRSAFASSRRPSAPVVVAAPDAYVEPMPMAAPARYDAVYHLDAGDKLRVVVYGQEGLTNTYAIDAGGSITMPLIGSVPARGRTTAAHDVPYHLDAGDKLRVVVFGQEGLTNTYAIDAGGAITMPLIGAVAARGKTPAGLAADISARLRNGYIREPSVAVEVESYRPFFILGEVAAPGQYPYVPNMSVESAVAIAGGFSPRAKRDSVTLTHNAGRTVVPLGTSISPGDTVLVGERWF